jgi:hypothetical protein
MLKYAAATALVIALIITMLTPADSGPRREEDCDGWRPDWGRSYVIRCHCSFECSTAGYYPALVPFPIQACMAKCVKAKEAARR